MKTKTAKLLVGLMIATSMVLMTYAIVAGYGASPPVVWTDKSNYYPGDTASIYGSGFNPNSYYDIPVIRPDGTIVRGDGSFTPGWDTVRADKYGRFTYYYKLDGILGLYEVRVYDSPWSGSLAQTPLATTDFTDAPPKIDLDQVRNGAFNDPTDPGEWVNGNVGGQQGHYVEGYSIPYRTVMTDMPTGKVITLTIEYDIKHSDKHAIDYLTNYSRINNPSHELVFGHPPEVIDPLIDVIGPFTQNSTFPIPAPSSAGSPVPGQPTASYNNLVGNETIASVYMSLFGGTISNIVYNIEGNLAASISSTSINVTFTLNDATAVLAWGGHIASREDWGFTNGVPNSAGGISGSPYHMRLLAWSWIEPPNVPNLGNTDRSLSAVAVFAPVAHPNITLTKTPSSTKVENGTLVTYTYNVTNTGDVTLNVSLVDDHFGTIFTNLTLASGESNITTITRTLFATTTNIANATGVYPLTSASVNATASASVTVLHPSISLTKTPSSTKVEDGASVTYTYVITNTGDTALTVSLVDDTFGTLFTGKVMAPGAVNTTTIIRTLTVTTTNIATATGVDQLSTSVSDEASASVTVLHPSISLTKTPSSTKVLNGSSVTYTYNVTNTGDTTLMGINVTDNLLGFIGSTVLAPGQSATFTSTTTLTTNTTNTATAVGVDQLGTRVQDTTSGSVVVIHPAISVVKTCSPEDQLAPGTITWTVIVTNTGDVTLTAVNVTDTRHGVLDTGITLAPGQNSTYTIVESGLPPGTYYDNATAFGAHQLGTVSAWDDATCTVRPVVILKQFTAVTVLPEGISEGYSATLVNSTLVNVTGLHSGPKIYFTVTYYFENSLNFLGSDFDGQAHNFTLWDKWGGNLMALGSPPASFNQQTNNLTLADGTWFIIDPTLTGTHTYRGYIGSGLDISNLASQGQAWITMHLGDQQNSTNPGKGKGTNKDGSSYDTDTVWYIGQLGVNQSATLTLYIAPGKNPGGQLLFSSPGCFVINTGPRVRAYGNTYDNADFLYAVERTNTLTVCVTPFASSSLTTTSLRTKTASTFERLYAWSGIFLFALLPVYQRRNAKSRKFRWLSHNHI